MKKNNMNIHVKRTYSAPLIEQVILDNEISLVLQSDPGEPGASNSITPEYFNNDPFKTYNG